MQLPEINLSAVYFLLVNCVLMPFLVVRTHLRSKRITRPEIPRRKLYISSILVLTALTLLALVVVVDVRLPLFPIWRPKPGEVAVGLLLLVGWFVLREVLIPLLRKGAEKSPVRMPTTWRQFVLWCGVSLVAGVGEEIIYRGVMYSTLAWWLGSSILAVVVSAVVFGLAHMTQGPRSALFITAVALSMHWLVLWSGTLYMAMIVHATFDAAVGLRYLLQPHRRVLWIPASPTGDPGSGSDRLNS